jgi:hypothetical protein
MNPVTQHVGPKEILRMERARRMDQAPASISLMSLVLTPAEAARVGAGLSAVVARNRFQADCHAREMLTIAGDILRANLTPTAVKKLRSFGSGQRAPILLVRGLPNPPAIPPTPFRGYGDDAKTAFGDLLLLGIYDLMGVEPVAYEYENLGRLFRNVVPNPDAQGEKSSHGYDTELGWHTDNPTGVFEPERLSTEKKARSPSPRYLGFSPLRNMDGQGQSVPTEVLALDRVLERLSRQALAVCLRPEFRIDPPPSNRTRALVQAPLLSGRKGRYFVRFNVNPAVVRGLTSAARWGLQQLQHALDEAEHHLLAFNLEPSTLLVFDNYRVFHRRRRFDPGIDWAAARWLRRCYACRSLLHGNLVDRLHCPNLWH